MARPRKDGMKNFPKWNPQRTTKSKMKSSDKKTRYKALRNSSSGFIKREDVRNFIFERDSRRCVLCGSVEGLQIDHIVSVYEFAIRGLDINMLNHQSNLQTLCRKCNSSKAPDEYDGGRRQNG